MRKRALLASASATQSDINPEFAFEWHLQYPEEGSIYIDAKDDENVVKAFDTLLRIHEVLGDNLNYGEIPQEYNITVNGVRLTGSSMDSGTTAFTIFESSPNATVYFGDIKRDRFTAIKL